MDSGVSVVMAWHESSVGKTESSHYHITKLWSVDCLNKVSLSGYAVLPEWDKCHPFLRGLMLPARWPVDGVNLCRLWVELQFQRSRLIVDSLQAISFPYLSWSLYQAPFLFVFSSCPLIQSWSLSCPLIKSQSLSWPLQDIFHLQDRFGSSATLTRIMIFLKIEE